MGYQGIIIEALGGGHSSPVVADRLEQAAKEMPVVLCSRAGSGETLRQTYGFPGSETDLLSRGLIGSGFLDGPKARILRPYCYFPMLRIRASKRLLPAILIDRQSGHTKDVKDN